MILHGLSAPFCACLVLRHATAAITTAAAIGLQGTFWIDMATALPWFMQVVVPFVDPASAQGVITVMMVLRLVRGTGNAPAGCVRYLLFTPKCTAPSGSTI